MPWGIMPMNCPAGITCGIGAGYVGRPTSTVIAEKCPDFEVTIADIKPFA